LGPLGHSLAALGAVAALPFAAVGLASRRAWRVGLRERLGAMPPSEPGGVWLHAASVGEARAAHALIATLSGDDAEPRVQLLTASTVAGRETSRAASPHLPVALAPLDHPWCVEWALARVRPSALVMLETELWPQWIAAAARRQVPVGVVSGRLSDESFARHLRFGRLLRSTLRRLAAVGARSELDAERFLTLGVEAGRVEVTGDLKLAVALNPPALSPELERLLGRARYFVAGSTHEGEETAALSALTACERAGHAIALVLAPRHLDRVEAVSRELAKSGRRVVRRSLQSGAAPLAAGDVLLLDTLGELAAVYAGAAAAFVGGTLAPKGGHNILEPVGAGCPVIFGPRIENVRSAAALLVDSGAGLRVEDAAGLADAIATGLRSPGAWRAAAARGQLALASHSGAAERSAALVARVVGRIGTSGDL
jgi:3-deoxy-D-manno-octulosonic-acid transferase